MTDDKKMMHGEVSPEQENILENVSGGKVEFTKPVYDQNPYIVPCPACGGGIDIDSVNPPYRVHCSSCGRWFHYEGVTLVEE